MEVRSFVTASAVLLSTGALVTAVPMVLVPQSEIQIAAESTAPPKQMTIQQVRLMALSDITDQGLSDAYFHGYRGAVTGPPEGTPAPTGILGAANYLVDTALPADTLAENIAIGIKYLPAIRKSAIDVANSLDPTGKYELGKRVDNFFEDVTTKALGDAVIDNLPDDTFAKGVAKAYFGSYRGAAGTQGVVNYVSDAIDQRDWTPTPGGTTTTSDKASVRLLSTEADTDTDADSDTTTAADPGTAKLPNSKSLVKLSTPNIEPKIVLPKIEPKLERGDTNSTIELPTIEPKVELTKVEPTIKIPKVKTELPKVESPKATQRTVADTKSETESSTLSADDSEADTSDSTAGVGRDGSVAKRESKSTQSKSTESKSTESKATDKATESKPTESKKSAGEKSADKTTSAVKKAADKAKSSKSKTASSRSSDTGSKSDSGSHSADGNK
ncbi:hypothetical protein A5740_13605 [Mycobacterium sp. GA-1841]|uniref:hypothetical protein n=1 Tax=Mycobacterium sp. GA-1841 TaxID=1834154 RepID=UPI00096E8DBC|nr:hypothetical protein [Mycobacterium sp. GA-1841]OMC32153.1 hypothetical protein A5740_13605 [Mycobacterium sp. GA-1841]